MTPKRVSALRVIRRIVLGLGLLSVATVAAIAWSVSGTTAESPLLSAQNGEAGWGHEALSELRVQLGALSPVPVANACGMGASSCFKCHNGKRAAAPKTDRQSGLWHVQHKTVNHSCVGCHAGNARIIKQEMAHEGLIADPRTKPETCASCHKADNPTALLATYQQPK